MYSDICSNHGARYVWAIKHQDSLKAFMARMDRSQLHSRIRSAWLYHKAIKHTTDIPPVFVVTIASGIQDRRAAAPQIGPWSSDYKLVNSPTFPQAMSAISSLVFAFAGTPIFFPIVAEMRNPHDYLKALVVSQTCVTCAYVIIGVVVYYYCGTYVASPALGSAGVLMKKICYGIALPGLLVTTVLICHVSPSSRVKTNSPGANIFVHRCPPNTSSSASCAALPT
jgi:ABC-type multidrug transport system permease subunit